MLERLIARAMNPVLNRLGTGWKSAVGLTALAAAAILSIPQIGLLDKESAGEVQKWAEILFGIGVFHKVTKRVGVRPN